MKVAFGLIQCSGNLIFVASATSENRPSANFVAAEVPKAVWAFPFCEVFIFPLFTQTWGPTKSILMRIHPCWCMQGFRRGGANSGGVGSSSIHITVPTSSIYKIISCSLVWLLLMWSCIAYYLRVVSLGNLGVNFFYSGRNPGILGYTSLDVLYDQLQLRRDLKAYP